MLGRVQSSPDNHTGYNEELSVLERQRAIFQRLYESQQHISSLSHQNLAQFSSLISEHTLDCSQMQNFPIKIDPQIDQNSSFLNVFDREQRNWSSSDFTNNNSLELARQSYSTFSNSSITTTSRPLHKENVVSTKKRKAEFVEEDNCKTKKHEAEAGDLKSEIIVENEKVTSTNNLKENSTNSEVKKPDYIHVRARRGQATDSHSLAERARREKIGKKMKCLQDLVPGCNKVIGKAGMLDEIINYVQSLQKQVEFLSMKLAASNNTDSNIFATYMANFPTMAAPSTLEIANIPAFLQNNLIQQQQGSSIGRENCLMSSSEAFLDSSHVPAGQQLPSFETDLQCLFGVRFQ